MNTSSTRPSSTRRSTVTARAFAAAFLAGFLALTALAHAAGDAEAAGPTPGAGTDDRAAPSTRDPGERAAPRQEDTCCCMYDMPYGCKVAGDPTCKYSRERASDCTGFMYGCVADSYCGG